MENIMSLDDYLLSLKKSKELHKKDVEIIFVPGKVDIKTDYLSSVITLMLAKVIFLEIRPKDKDTLFRYFTNLYPAWGQKDLKKNMEDIGKGIEIGKANRFVVHSYPMAWEGMFSRDKFYHFIEGYEKDGKMRWLNYSN